MGETRLHWQAGASVALRGAPDVWVSLVASTTSCVDVCSDHDTGLHEGRVNLADGVDEAGISEGEVLVDSDVPVLANGRAHDLLETRVDDVDFIGTLKLGGLVLEAHELKELGLGLDLILLGHTAWGDVVQVLEPLEV